VADVEVAELDQPLTHFDRGVTRRARAIDDNLRGVVAYPARRPFVYRARWDVDGTRQSRSRKRDRRQRVYEHEVVAPLDLLAKLFAADVAE
jgi:hypothetical protein